MAKRAIRIVRDEFNALLDDANETGYDRKFPCFNRPDLYTDYDRAPSPEEAEEMCAGCPIYNEHREYGIVTKPGWGIHGGIAYRYGKPASASVEDDDEKIAN
jgi:hypothetical protein